MSKFNKGNKVRVVKGLNKGLEGVITDAAWQISQSDWPRVECTDKDGMYFYADEENLELTEDPYEYGATWKNWHGVYFPVLDGEWGTLEEAQAEANDAEDRGNTGAKIMRRLKAGEAEDFNV